jgi:rhodanese-related sulfurtransferase
LFHHPFAATFQCAAASAECARAVSWGYEKIYFYGGGLDAWKAAGYPVKTGD